MAIVTNGMFLELEMAHREQCNPGPVNSGDVDGDGDVDIVTSSCGELVWFENADSSGGFSEPQRIAVGPGFGAEIVENPVSSLADLDRDGDLDVLVVWTAPWGSRISWFENVDEGSRFSEEIPIIEDYTYYLWSSVAADMDRDGDLDVLGRASGELGDGLVWHENTHGQFSDSHVISPSRGDHISAFASDLDGDGDTDVVSENGFWYESRLIGDSNNDGVFNSPDLVAVFQIGKYEDGIDDNATFDEGDWDQDGDFDTSDLVFAFQHGNYETAAQAANSQVAAAVDAAFTEENSKTRRSTAFFA